MRRIALILLLLVGVADAKTIYVSKAGSNTNPYDTWAKAATHINTVEASTAAGDTILIGQGVYLGSQIEPPTGSTRPNMTYYLDSAYVANGASDYSGLAQINGADTIPKSTWAVYSGNVYRASWTGTDCDAEQGDEGMTYFATQDGVIMEPQSGVAGVNAAGEMYHDLGAGYVYVQCFGNVNPNTVEIQVACRAPVIFRDTDQDNIFFGGLDIRNGKRAAVLFLAGSDSCIWRHCQITRASYCQTCNPAVIMSNTHDYDAVAYDSSGNWEATYNRFNEFVACSIGVATAVGGVIGQHGGSGMIFYDATDTYVDSCVFYDLPGDGIEIKNSTWEISIGDGVCSRITVARSFFDTQWSAGVFLYTNAAQCSLYGNIFYKSQDAGVCIGNSTSSTRKDFGLHFIANNTFYQNNCALQVQNSANTANTYADFTGEFKYNIIYDRVASTDAVLADNSEHYDFRDPISNLDIDIDSNQIHEPSGTFSAFWGDRTLRNWSYWQGTALNDEYGDTTSPGLNTTTFATTTAKTMSKTYGGQTWTRYGAIQPDAACPDTLVAPVFESPANGATGQQNSVILDWSDSTQVGTVTAYDLQVDNNSDYSSITFSSSPTDSRDTVTTTLTHLTTYYWRVRSRTACDTSAWSASRTFVVDAYVWTMPSRRANPVNSWLDSMSTVDDMSAYLCGMDDVAGTDADTLVARGKWKVVVWSGNPENAVIVKSRDSTVKLILYNSIDHGLRSNDIASDTSDPDNTWNTTSDEYSHYKKVATDSSKHYYSLFYHFAEDTKILLFPNTGGGYTRNDTVYFKGATLPISDDDSSSVIPDTYARQFFTGNITLDTISVDTTGTIISRAFRYQGTPQTWAGGDSSRVTRVYPDFSNPLTRYAELKYSTRMFAPNLNNLGGTDNDVYGWGLMSDSGFIWDGVYYDNSSDESNLSPAGMTILSGGNIRGSTGVLGKWNADSTRMKMRAHQKTFFAYTTDYCNDGSNFSDGIARATSANFGTWSSNQSASNPIQVWFNDSNRINVKLIEFAAFDGAYSIPAYESATTLGYSVAQLNRLDSLARNNDFYVFFSGRINHQDTTVASGWSVMKDGFLRSNWVRVKTTMGHRAIFAPSPTFALTTGYFPCNSSDGSTYGGLIYNHCYNRTDVDQFIGYNSLPFMRDYDLGKKVADSSATLTLTDGTAQTVSVYKTFWRDVVGTDTTYSWMYYFPRSLSSWEWRPSGNHYVLINPPPPLFKRLEYDGTLTTINSDAQTCYIGNQLILSYTTSAEPYIESPMNILRGINLKGVTIK